MAQPHIHIIIFYSVILQHLSNMPNTSWTLRPHNGLMREDSPKALFQIHDNSIVHFSQIERIRRYSVSKGARLQEPSYISRSTAPLVSNNSCHNGNPCFHVLSGIDLDM